MPLTEQKCIAIAEMLNKGKGKGLALSSEICKTLKVNGRQVGQVSKMIERGLIAFDEETDEPYFVTPFKEIQKHYLREQKGMNAEDIAEKGVHDAVQGEIADEATKQAQQYILLGKAVWQAYVNHAVKKGLTLDDIRQTPIHQVIINALEKAEKYELEKEENKLLREQVQYLQGETNPIIRLKTTMKRTNEILTLLVALDTAGFNIEPLIPHYERIINGYLIGVA